MKRAWRWPFAGFVVGALVGATILTVNVVGASSPERPPAGAGSFGEILHTPVLLARAGEPVELRYDVVCGASQEEPEPRARRRALSSSVPGAGRRSSSIRSPATHGGLLSATVPAGEASAGFDYYAEIENGRGQTRALPEGAAAAPHHVWPLRIWTTVAPRRALPRDAGSRLGGRQSSRGARASTRSGSTAAASSRASGRRRSTSLPTVRSSSSTRSTGSSSSCAARSRSELPIAFAGGEGDLAVAHDGTIYVLDAVAAAPSVAAYTPAGDLIARDAAGRAERRHGAGGPQRADRARVPVRDVASDRGGAAAADSERADRRRAARAQLR